MDDEIEIQRRVREHVDRLGVPYRWIDIDPAFADTAAFCERYGYRPEASGNTILVASKKEPRRFCACVVQASSRLDVNRTVRRLLGAKKASFATAEETRERTGMMIGGVTCFALPDGLPIYVDANLLREDTVIVGGGGRSSKIEIAPSVFERIDGAVVVDDLAVAAAG